MEQQPTNPQRPMVDDVKPPVSETPQIPSDVVASIQEAPVSSPMAQSNVVQPPAEETPEASSESSADDTASQAEAASPQTSPTTSKRPLIMVITALLVGLALAGLSVFAYLSTNKTEEPVADTAATSDQAAPAVTEVTEDIDQTLQTLDAETDFSKTELSDEALGL